APPKSNRGWFQRDDPRINREGRPHGTKADIKGGTACGLAPRADRLKMLVLAPECLLHCMGGRNPHPVANLPEDVEVVASWVDSSRGVVLTVRSQTFPRVAK